MDGAWLALTSWWFHVLWTLVHWRDVIVLLATVGAAAGTLAAAGAAWRSAADSKRAAQANLQRGLMQQYASHEMFEALKGLHRWQRTGQPRFGVSVHSPGVPDFHVAAREWAANTQVSGALEEAHEFDGYRRTCMGYFYLVAHVVTNRDVPDAAAKELLTLADKQALHDLLIPALYPVS